VKFLWSYYRNFLNIKISGLNIRTTVLKNLFTHLFFKLTYFYSYNVHFLYDMDVLCIINTLFLICLWYRVSFRWRRDLRWIEKMPSYKKLKTLSQITSNLDKLFFLSRHYWTYWYFHVFFPKNSVCKIFAQ
jgi:hypothetical protein